MQVPPPHSAFLAPPPLLVFIPSQTWEHHIFNHAWSLLWQVGPPPGSGAALTHKLSLLLHNLSYLSAPKAPTSSSHRNPQRLFCPIPSLALYSQDPWDSPAFHYPEPRGLKLACMEMYLVKMSEQRYQSNMVLAPPRERELAGWRLGNKSSWAYDLGPALLSLVSTCPSQTED